MYNAQLAKIRIRWLYPLRGSMIPLQKKAVISWVWRKIIPDGKAPVVDIRGECHYSQIYSEPGR